MQVSDVSSSVQLVPLHSTLDKNCSLCRGIADGYNEQAAAGLSYLEDHQKVESFAQSILLTIKKEAYAGNCFLGIKLGRISNSTYQALEECFKKKKFEWILIEGEGIQVKITWTRENSCIYDPRITDLLKLPDFTLVNRDKKLWEHALNKINCDFTIISGDGEEIPVHRCVIRAHSKMIDQLLNQECFESTNSEIKYLKASTKVVKAFIKYLYTKNILEANQTDSKSSYTTEELLHIFDFSEYLGKRKLSIMCIHHIDRSSTLKEKQELLSDISSRANPARFQNQVFITTLLFWANAYDPMLGSFAKGIHGCDETSYAEMQKIAEQYSLDKVKAALDTYEIFAFGKSSNSYENLGASFLASSSMLRS